MNKNNVDLQTAKQSEINQNPKAELSDNELDSVTGGLDWENFKKDRFNNKENNE